jgi:hypothetical protein
VRSIEQRDRVAALIAGGLNDCQIERETGIPRRTICDWRRSPLGRTAQSTCAVCEGTPERLHPASYAYLLGAYLGDGYIVAVRRGVCRLRVACDLLHRNIAWWIALAIEDVRGLIHSDGSRHINRIKHPKPTYEYVRYEFSNRSDDIKRIFCEACDALGVQWRVMNRDSTSVARRASVERLDEFIGPKR